jgi:hypothetical protein
VRIRSFKRAVEGVFINILRVKNLLPKEQRRIVVENLSPNDEFTGRTTYCRCLKSRQYLVGTWELTSGLAYATINSYGRLDIAEGANNQEITISFWNGGSKSITKTITVSYGSQLDIECSDTISGTSGNVIARYNHKVVAPTWSIVSGNAATISNDGTITILGNGNVTIQATYNGYAKTKVVSVQYVANSYSQTIVDNSGTVTTQTCIVTQNQDGTTTTTSTGEIREENGNRSTFQSQAQTGLPDQSGAITTTTTTTYYDESGSETGTGSQTVVSNSDGSET